MVSPLIKPNTVDHKFYNTDSVLRTMEAFLGLPPMNVYDATAPVIADFEKRPVNEDAFKAIMEDDAIIAARNPEKTSLRPGTPAYRMAALADKMDFVHPDSAPAAVVNEMLWKSVKGASSTMPAIVHRPGITPKKDVDGDGD